MYLKIVKKFMPTVCQINYCRNSFLSELGHPTCISVIRSLSSANVGVETLKGPNQYEEPAES